LLIFKRHLSWNPLLRRDSHSRTTHTRDEGDARRRAQIPQGGGRGSKPPARLSVSGRTRTRVSRGWPWLRKFKLPVKARTRLVLSFMEFLTPHRLHSDSQMLKDLAKIPFDRALIWSIEKKGFCTNDFRQRKRQICVFPVQMWLILRLYKHSVTHATSCDASAPPPLSEGEVRNLPTCGCML